MRHLDADAFDMMSGAGSGRGPRPARDPRSGGFVGWFRPHLRPIFGEIASKWPLDDILSDEETRPGRPASGY